MDERQEQDREKNSGDKSEPEAAKAASVSEGAVPADAQSSAASDLPSVESPKLGGEAVEEPVAEAVHGSSNKFAGALPALFAPIDEAPGEPAAASAAQPRSMRFALLAATIACAAGIGALVGSLSASGIGRQHAAEAAIPTTAAARDVVQALKTQLAELSALKTSLDAANRSAGAQFSRIADRLNSLERAQAEPAAKLAHIADAVDRLGKQTAAPEITGSIAAAPPASPAPALAAKLAVPGPVLHDWVVQGVRNGRAMLESRFGGLFLVGSGSVVPGLGRVQDVKRQDGEWVVVTERGLVTSRP